MTVSANLVLCTSLLLVACSLLPQTESLKCHQNVKMSSKAQRDENGQISKAEVAGEDIVQRVQVCDEDVEYCVKAMVSGVAESGMSCDYELIFTGSRPAKSKFCVVQLSKLGKQCVQIGSTTSCCCKTDLCNGGADNGGTSIALLTSVIMAFIMI